MNCFTRLIAALQASRRREAERVVQRYSHLVAQAEEYERQRAAEIAQAEETAAARAVMRLAPRRAS